MARAADASAVQRVGSRSSRAARRSSRAAHCRCALATPPIAQLPRMAAAGGLAGAIVNGVLHPLDTVKSVRQADPAHYPRRTLGTLLQLVRESGPRALYRGLGPALLGAATSSALYFGTYETVKAFLLQRGIFVRRGELEREQARREGAAALGPGPRGLTHMVAAACGNIASSVVFVPKEVIKQRLQAGRARSAVQVVRQQHVRGLYNGYRSTLLRNVPTTMLNFLVYEEAKLWLARAKKGGGARAVNSVSSAAVLSTPELMLAGSVAGALSSSLTTPFDVLKTKFSTAASADVASLSIPQMVARVVRQEGAGGMFRGLGARAFWAAAFSALGFSTYELCKKALAPPQDASTGDEKRARVNRREAAAVASASSSPAALRN